MSENLDFLSPAIDFKQYTTAGADIVFATETSEDFGSNPTGIMATSGDITLTFITDAGNTRTGLFIRGVLEPIRVVSLVGASSDSGVTFKAYRSPARTLNRTISVP